MVEPEATRGPGVKGQACVGLPSSPTTLAGTVWRPADLKEHPGVPLHKPLGTSRRAPFVLGF
eukprot:1526368-Alexandrium_andersonii.AAC.1